MTQFTEEELALGRQVIETCRELERRGLNQGTAGNISIRLAERKEGFLITPTALPYDLMQPEDIAHLKLDGARAGRREPSSEWRIHLDVMRRRPEVGAIIHTHSGHATALACLRRPIPSFHYMVALFGGEDIRCSEYATYGTQELSDRVLEALEGRSAALMGSHGLIVLAPTLQRAMALTVEAETLAMMYLRAISAGEPALLPADEMARVKEKLAAYVAQSAPRPPAAP
ncbi:MAG: class II aldolase/adducin family protein [Elusimicrobia bacterium]|nr:class II aldolase/adducin family protein [Elusimicrobiota bacterium]